MFKTLPLGRGLITYSIGFGWDSIADDYKVVKIDFDFDFERQKNQNVSSSVVF